MKIRVGFGFDQLMYVEAKTYSYLHKLFNK